jgi:predicted nucleotidyltransferase
MSQDQAKYEIVGEARALSKVLPRIAWYGFGSYFRGQSAFQDIDVLVVCDTTEEAIFVRAHTAELCARWPLHLVIMTQDEAAETGFVATESCEPLSDY